MLSVVLGMLLVAGTLYVVVEVLRASKQSPLFMVLWSLPILASFGVMLVMPLYLRWTARNLAYAITDRRVLTVERGLFGNVEFMSFAADTLEPRSRRYANGVSGDIELIANRVYDDEISEELVRLFALRDVGATEAALRNLIQSSSKSSL